MQHEVEFHLTVKTYTHDIIKYNNRHCSIDLHHTTKMHSLHSSYITCFRCVTNVILSTLFINYFAFRHKQTLRVISTIILSIFVTANLFFSLIKYKLLSKRSPSWQKSSFCYGNKQFNSYGQSVHTFKISLSCTVHTSAHACLIGVGDE